MSQGLNQSKYERRPDKTQSFRKHDDTIDIPTWDCFLDHSANYLQRLKNLAYIQKPTDNLCEAIKFSKDYLYRRADFNQQLLLLAIAPQHLVALSGGYRGLRVCCGTSAGSCRRRACGWRSRWRRRQQRCKI